MRPRARRVARGIVDALTRPQWARPGHFYSPVNGRDDIERSLGWAPDTAGIALEPESQIQLFDHLLPLFGTSAPRRYTAANRMYGLADAEVYQAILRTVRPKQVIEVGSGFSTAVLLDTVEQLKTPMRITCIEPYPERLRDLLLPGDELELIADAVQNVPVQTFLALESSDVLFIDSSHVAKAGSDVVWLLTRVLPRLASGVWVHLHDIFWPFEYPVSWLEEGRSWNEAYLLHAFLCHNHAWDVQLFSSWLWREHPELVPPRLAGEEPGSIWIRRR